MVGLRPTGERVRETLFNWLAPVVPGARCLDLFAGTGALGLEALSRGAREVVFVEKSQAAVATLRKNIAALEAAGAVVHHVDAGAFLESGRHEPFDIVFLDPPFADALLEQMCRLLDEHAVLAPGARVYVEQGRDANEPTLPAGWAVSKTKTAGNVRYSLITVDKTETTEPTR